MRSLLSAGHIGAEAVGPTTFYALFNGQSGDGEYKIGAATRAFDTWTEYASNPVLTKGNSGAWDDDHVKDPWLMYVGGQYVMYYSGHDGSKYQIGRATASSHEGPWTKYASNPVLTVGAGGAFDDSNVGFPTVLYEPSDTGKEWKMWYGADADGSWGASDSIGYAYSTNGTSWTKVGEVLTQGSSGAWDDEGLEPAAIYKEGSTYYLFYQGRQDSSINKWQGGVATFTNPEGTYTKHASNPLMLARFNDSPISFSLTANTSAGGTTATIADTTKYNVGEQVMLYDADTAAETFYVTSKTSTVLTLDHAATGAFTTAQNALVRPFSMVSVIPRTVRPRSGGGYEAFVTLFQPIEDLALVGSKLWEGAFEMRASSLTGAWTYNYVAGRGLLFPLTPTGAAWHARSAENPSVIAKP